MLVNSCRKSQDEISQNLFNFIIGLTLLWGFGINWFIVTSIPVESVQSIPSLIFLLGYIVMVISGAWMFQVSSDPWVSFTGYNLVVLPVGFVLNLYLSEVDPLLIREAIEVTGLVTGVMLLMGTIFPRFFVSIGPALCIALVSAIVIELIMFFVVGKSKSILDFIIAILFAGFIAHDWAKANSMPKTIDNAVDGAANLYLSIINFFMRYIFISKD